MTSPNAGTDATTTAQVPPSSTGTPAMYEPVYLSDAQVATMERVKNGTVGKSHEAVEADKVGAR